jgi:hypothetical protein
MLPQAHPYGRNVADVVPTKKLLFAQRFYLLCKKES